MDKIALLSYVCLVSTVFFLISLCPASNIYAKEVLRVGVYNNKPTIFQDNGGKTKGLFIDILEEIAINEGWELEYVPGHFSELYDELKAGTIDLLPALAYVEEREQFVDYTYETVMANWAELYVPDGASLTSLIELEGKKIGVKQGDIHFQVLKDMTENFNISCRFLETDEYTTVFEMLHANFVDVGVVNRLYGNENKASYRIKATPVIFNPIEMRYAVSEGKNEQIIAKIDSYLTSFKMDEKSIYYRSVNRWFVVSGQDSLPQWIFYLFYGVVGTVSLLLGATVLFRYQVKKRTMELTKSNEQLEAQVEERQRAEEELRKYARIVEASSDAMALIDLDHRHVLYNSEYRNIVTVSGVRIDGMSVKDVFGEEFFKDELESAVSLCLEGRIVDLQVKPQPNPVLNRYLNITLSPYLADSGEIHGYVVDIRDVTPHVELQNRLKNAQKMEAIGLLAGGVAHDLNNILSGIVSYPDMLLIDRSPDDPMTVPLNIIKKSGERAAAIVQDLLTLARRGFGNVTVLNLNAVIRDFWVSPEQGEIIRQAEGVTFTLDLDDTLYNVNGSMVHISKVLMNIFVNGVEAMPGGGTLTIRTENQFLDVDYTGFEIIPRGEYSVLRISDTGIGMSVSEINRIFEPFYTSKIMGRSGTGLGMAVVWGTIKDLNGFINISSAPGKGTEFSLYFPTTREEIVESDIVELKSYKGNGQDVLVIDDMEEQRELASRILILLGYNVKAVSSGEEAIEICSSQHFDLLILDMIMPGGMDGCATYEKIASIRPGQKAIIASGFSDNTSVRKAQALGAGAYIKKPYTVEVFARAIYQELEAGA
jgi:two-component system cell cycle sensor histidine kinase/response regulator CckA